jgi:hypothetical protein
VVSFLPAFPLISYTCSSSPHLCYMPYLSHPPWLDHPDYTLQKVQVMKLFIMQLPPPSCHFIPFISNTLSLCSSLKVGDQVSCPYRTMSKITLLYILIVLCLENRWEDKRFWTECWQTLLEFKLHSISCGIKFWFVTVVPKYLNCATSSKDLFAIFMS